MTEPRRYKYPRIMEAICEFHFAGSQWDSTIPGLVYERVTPLGYTTKRELHQFETQVVMTQKGPSENQFKMRESRMRFITEDERRLIQLENNLLIVNRLLPYPGYDQWLPDIQKAFEVYHELARPEKIASVTLRYLNVFSYREPRILMEDYYCVYPQLSGKFGNEHGQFVLRIELPADHADRKLLLTLGNANINSPYQLAHLLDIAAEQSLDSLEWRTTLDELHSKMVETFEGSITDKTRKMIDEEPIS